MKNDILYKKLSNLHFKSAIFESHKDSLKRALMPTNTTSFFQSLFKIAIGFTVITLIAFWSIVNTVYFQSHTTSAHELIDEAITTFSLSESPEDQLKVNILNQIKNAESIEYKASNSISTANIDHTIFFSDLDNNSYQGAMVLTSTNGIIKDINFPYIKDNDAVYWGTNRIEGVDTESFEIFPGQQNQKDYNFQYARDKYRIYHNFSKYSGRNIIPDADVETFQLLGSGYAKDKNYVYMQESKILDADPDSFQLIISPENSIEVYYAKDKNYVFFAGKKIDVVDINSFHALGARGEAYGVDDYAVYIANEKIKNADPKTFKILGHRIAKDKNYVYFDGVIIDADVNSFQVLEWPGFSENGVGHVSYAKDSKQVYYYSNDDVEGHSIQTLKILHGADPQTFEPLNYLYSKDAYSIYAEGEKIEDADPKTFSLINDDLAKDSKRLYVTPNFQANALLNADPGTFVLLSSDYAKDASKIYLVFTGTELKGADVETFEILGNGTYGYARDKNHVYQYGNILKNLDPSTFQILTFDNSIISNSYAQYYFVNKELFDTMNEAYVKDGQNVYFNGEKVIGADAETFTVIGGYYAKDQTTIYFEGQKVNEANVDSFKVSIFAPEYAIDTNNSYKNGKIFLK